MTPELPDGPFTRADGVAAGLTRHQLYGRALLVPFRGTRLRRDGPFDHLTRCRALALTLADDAAFSHVTALRLHGIELPWRLESDDAFHVVVRARPKRPQHLGVSAHVTVQRHLDVVIVDGLHVTSPAQTWMHLADRLSVDELVILGDAMTRREDPATTLEALREIVLHTRKRRGLAKARAALDLIRPGTDSSMETRTRLVLVKAGLPCPRVNERAYASDGRYLARPDMSYPDVKVAIEYLGDVHRRDVSTWRTDVGREERLHDDGWEVVRVTADMLRDPERLVARVRRAIARQRRRLQLAA